MVHDDHDLHWTVSRGVATHVSLDARLFDSGLVRFSLWVAGVPAAADSPVPPVRASNARTEGINRVSMDVGCRACGFRNPTNHSGRVR
jgi:hypothetical protein